MEREPDSRCCSHTYPKQGCRSPGRRSGWELKFRDCGAITGRGLLLTEERWMEGRWGKRLLWDMPVEESPAAVEARWYCWITWRAITMASLSPHTSIGCWTIERLTHQTPGALNYRVEPHPGGALEVPDVPIYRVGPLYVPDLPNDRKRPQAGKPAKVPEQQSYWERLAKETFWLPATGGLKKDCDRALTPVVEAVCVPAHLTVPGSPQAKQLSHLHAHLHWGRVATGKKSPVSMHAGSLW